MIQTTTPTIEGKKITRYLGVISADVILGANIFSDIFAGVRDIVGGRSATYERKFREGKAQALRSLMMRRRRSAPMPLLELILTMKLWVVKVPCS